MGALTGNRKRGEDYFTLNYKSPGLYSPDFDSPVSKKLKLLVPNPLSPERLVSSKSAASRVSQYPEPINRFRREVHAPCRSSRFGFACSSRPSFRGSSQKEIPADLMGNVLFSKYEKAKNTAIDGLRFFKKNKEAVKDDFPEDSSIEDIEVPETEGILAKYHELDKKAMEGSFQPSPSSVVSDLTYANNLDSVLPNREFDVSGVPLHKKLFETAERRNSRLRSLSFQIELKEKVLASLHLSRSVKKAEEDVPREPFVQLTEDEEAEVSRALSMSYRRKVLVNHDNSNIQITGELLQCLRPGAWLNDEVINVYLELLKEREKREPKKFLKCHFFNTFFYKKLIGGRSGYDFKSVRRWTTQRKLGYFLLQCDKIFVPIHKEVHWCLAVINKKEEKFQYLDSLGGIDSQVLKLLAKYFVDEVKDKSGKDIDVSSWKQEYVEDLPEQKNGYDCGVFMIKYADFYSRGLGLCFTQEHMPYFRQRTAKEILRLKAE